jgi:DNA-binding NarL/FixJ family response regulator
MARILVLVNDLLLGSKIREAVIASGHEAVFCSSAAALDAAVKTGAPAAAVLADLSPRGEDPIPAICELKRGSLAAVPVVGYFSHVDTATRQRAQEAGIDQVLPRSAFFGDLPALIERVAGGG